MATDVALAEGAKLNYLEELEGWVLDERKAVTFRWLALMLSVTANDAKKMLYEFCQRQGTQVWATYLVMGRSGSKGGSKGKAEAASLEVKLVPAEALESTRKAFETVTSVHIYSVQAAPATAPADAGVQLWATDLEHCKEMVERRTEAGDNLRTHRFSGVRCAAVVDVSPPSAPTPPAHVEEESPFASRRGAGSKGVTGGGAANNNKSGGHASGGLEKPKGKAIDPKDFFKDFSGAAAAGGASKGGKGKGKGKVAAPKRGGGGIGSFFDKSVPKEGIANREAEAKEKVYPVSDDDGTGKGVEKGATPVDGKETGGAARESEAVTSSSTSTFKIAVKVEGGIEEAEVGSGAKDAGAGTGTAVDEDVKNRKEVADSGTAGNGDVGGDVDDDGEVEWNEEVGNKSSTTKTAPMPAKSSTRAACSTPTPIPKRANLSESKSKVEPKDENTPADKAVAVKKATKNKTGSFPAMTTNGTADESSSTSATKKAKNDNGINSNSGRKSAKARGAPDASADNSGKPKNSSRGDDDKNTKVRSRRASESGSDGEEGRGGEKGEQREGMKGATGKKGAGKRKGRYDSDEKAVDEGQVKARLSGAMDTFTTGERGTAKRTKTVRRGRTYEDEGYMKTVMEEVEVTDDEEEPLQPSQTNNSRPPLSGTNARTTHVNIDGEGGKGNDTVNGTRGKAMNAIAGSKAKQAKALSSGKQSSMKNFFKKA